MLIQSALFDIKEQHVDSDFPLDVQVSHHTSVSKKLIFLACTRDPNPNPNYPTVFAIAGLDR